nr:hypothetical protein [Tanacetum cinerariifolium]
MTRVPNKKRSSFGYQKSPTVGSSSFRKDKGVANASNITMIKDVDPMLENITVQGRCISFGHSHRLNKTHNLYSLDMNSMIQIYIKKEWMFRFEPLFKEGQCYSISNFAIVENSDSKNCLHFMYGIRNKEFGTEKARLSAIGAEMGKLQNLIQESRRVLNLFLRCVRTLDPDLKEARIRAAIERIEDLEGRQQALWAKQEYFIVRCVTRCGHRGD